MTQSFNVQMNLQDTPQVQIEQSGTPSAKNSTAGSEESFNSVLQKALPEQNNTTSLTNNEKSQSDINSTPTGSSTHPDDSTLPTNILSKLSSTPALFQQIIPKNSDNRVAELPLNRSVLDNSEKIIAALLTGQSGQGEADELVEMLPTVQAGQGETDKLTETPPTGQTGQGENNKLVATPTGTAVQSENNKLIATLTGPAGQSENDELIEKLPTVQTDQSETDKLIVTLPTGRAVLSTPPTDTIPPFSKDIAFSVNSSTDELSNKGKLNDLLNPLDAHPKNKLNVFQDMPGFGSGTKSLSDLQNVTTQTNNASTQKTTSEPPLPNVAITPSQHVITPQQGELLDRLSTIINNGNETGVLSIKKIPSNNIDHSLRRQLTPLTPKIDFTNASEEALTKMTTRGGDSFTVLEEGVFAPSLRNKQQNLSGIRQDSHQQWFNAKIQPQNSLNDSSNPGTKQQNDGMNQQSSGFDQLSVLTNKPEPGTIFTLQGTTVADPLATQVSTELKPTILPSGTLIHDQEVIKQLVDRFQVNHRQLESKIQLKLHPAELGKMEIDLTVKEGSIRANVVAQSQHVQEIVERNIAKLKTVLEQQGFNVEEITVTSESEMVGSFDLFDQHLSDNDSSTFLKNTDKSENNTSFIMEEFQDSYLDASTGVNVKV